MYFVGIIKTDFPKILINPKACDSMQDLYEWLILFFNKDDYKLDKPISLESLTTALQSNKPVRVNIETYPIAVLLGDSDLIQESCERFVHVAGLDLLTSTEKDIKMLIQKYVK